MSCLGSRNTVPAHWSGSVLDFEMNVELKRTRLAKLGVYWSQPEGKVKAPVESNEE